MSEKSRSHFFKEEEKVPVERRPISRTNIDTPFYVCSNLNDSNRNLETLPKSTTVIVLSRKNEPWIEVEVKSKHGFILSMFLEEVKNDG